MALAQSAPLFDFGFWQQVVVANGAFLIVHNPEEF
jgi:hypothetical protein